MVLTNKFRKLAWAVILCGLWTPELHASFIWNTNLGTAIPASTFDAGAGVVAESLDFDLPFEGTNYTGLNSLYVSEAGFVWLGGHNVAENTGVSSLSSATQLFNQGSPRVAAGWYDLDPDIGGNIYFNQTSNEAIITWVGVPSDSSTSDAASFQMQLFSTGEIIFSYELLDSASLGADPAVVIGLTQGGGNTAASTNLTSVLASQATGTEAANFYEYVTPSFNVVDESITFTPQYDGTWAVNAVPEPATWIPSAAGVLLICATFQRKRHLKY